jgi:hypothetical protein
VVGGCDHTLDSANKSAEQFCSGVQIALQTPSTMLSEARRSVSDGRCAELNEASITLTCVIVTFQAATQAFRDRPEVRRTLDALDNLPLAEVHALHCYRNDVNPKPSEPSGAEIAALLPKIDRVQAKLAAVTAACSSP